MAPAMIPNMFHLNNGMKNFGIAMLFDSRIHILQSGSHEMLIPGKNFDSLHDDNSILFDLVQLFGTLEIVISKDKDTFKLQCDYHEDLMIIVK